MTAASGASVETRVPRDDSLSHYVVVSSCDLTALSGRGPFILRSPFLGRGPSPLCGLPMVRGYMGLESLQQPEQEQKRACLILGDF